MKLHQKQLIGVFILGTLLRVLLINSRGIQYDDAFTILLASRSINEIIAGTAADTMPPLFYFILHFWLFLGRDLWIIRTLTVVISVASIYLAYLLVWELTMDRKAGLWTAVLVACSPLQIYHAQDIRMYALLAFSELAYMLFFCRIWQRNENFHDGWRNWLGLVVSGVVAMYTHNLAVFWMVVPFVFLAITRSWRDMGRMLLAVNVICLAALPWMVKIPGQIEKIQTAFWTPRPGLIEIFQSILMFNATLPLPQPRLLFSAILSLQILVLVSVEMIRGIKTQKKLLFLISFAVLPPVLLLVTSYLIRPVFVTRGFLAASFAYYGLAGYVISARWKRHIGKILVVGFVTVFMISLPYQIAYAEFPRSPFQNAMQVVKEEADAETIVLHDNKLSFFPCYYFAPELRQVFLPDDPGSLNDTLAVGTQRALDIFPEKGLAEGVNGFRKVYFVVFKTTIENYHEIDGSEHPVVVWLTNHYEFVEQQAYNDLLVFTFYKP